MNLQYPLEDSFICYKKVKIIQQKHGKILLVGYNNQGTDFADYSIIVINKIRSSEKLKNLDQIMTQIPGSLKQQQAQLDIQKHIKKISDCEVKQTHGIIGFTSFLQGYYLLYIQQREKIAKIGRHKISEIKKIGILPLFELRNGDTKQNQLKYRQILQSYKLQNFYYSYTYDLTNPLSKNMTKNAIPLFQNTRQQSQFANEEGIFSHYKNIHGMCQMFQWNFKLLQQFNSVVKKKKWLIPIIHGFLKQLNIKTKGTVFNIIIISRRSRHHAGTRYIKRGINQYGFVANFVQTEQIVINSSTSQDTKPICSSFIQVRGSVPVYWMQQPSILVPKPPIQIIKMDILFVSTRKHISDLIGRYGRYNYFVNLMKTVEKSPRQTKLSEEFANAIQFINNNDLNEENKINYLHLDMKLNLKNDKQAFIDKIHLLSYMYIMKTGMFVCINSSRTNYSQYVQFQNGVIRANCVDCLDRTNSFQQLVGQMALQIQISKLLKQQIHYKNLMKDDKIFKEYRILYENMGDLLSIQYGSSLAHKQKVNKTQASNRFEFLTSITRHWNNNLKDYDRQQQIDVFLRQFDITGAPIWQVKPEITFFPNKKLNKFDKAGWDTKAYEYFCKDHKFEMFEKLHQKQKLNIRKYQLQNIEQIQKEQFALKYGQEIVLHLKKCVNTKILAYCVSPKLILQKRVWRQLNPKSNSIRSFQDKFKKQYHKMNFVKEEIVRQKQIQNHPEQISSDEDVAIKDFIHSTNMNQKAVEKDLLLKQQILSYLQQSDQIDEQEVNLIKNYINNSVFAETLVDQDLQNLKNRIGDYNNQIDVNLDYSLNNSDWKILEDQITNKDFLNFQEQSMNLQNRRKQKKKVTIIGTMDKLKIQKIDQHITIVLEDTIKKNFSHGHKVGRISKI